MGYYRKQVLRVDLTHGTTETESIPDEYYEKFVGGWGLGLTPEDDYGDVGQRLLDPIPEGDEFSGVSFEPYIQGLVEEYYSEMGWDVATGRPYRSTLERLDLEPFVGRIW